MPRRIAPVGLCVLLLHCAADDGETAGRSGGLGGTAATGGDAGAGGAGGAAAAGNGGVAGTGVAGSVGVGGSLTIDSGSCTPNETSETLCDGLDNDCDGKVDNVDVGGDGICDCLRLGIIGSPGTLPSANFQAWLAARGTKVERKHTTGSEPFDAAFLNNYDVLVIDRLPRPYTAAEAAALETWVDAGGGFISMTGYTNTPDPDFLPNALLAPFGLEYVPPLLIEDVTNFTPHPVTQGLSLVTFNGGYEVRDNGAGLGTSTPIARVTAGPVAVAHERGMGRAVAWGDEWITFDSEWQTIPEIETLWINVFAWIGPRNSCEVPGPPK